MYGEEKYIWDKMDETEKILKSIDSRLDLISAALISMSEGITKFLESYEKILSQQGIL
jgi:hypothetical protein